MITFSNVTKQFGNDTYGLVNISFGVQSGELVLITGHSGSGKTTLMRLLTKEYTPTSGDIIFEDQPLSELKTSQVHHHRRKIGVIFQDYKLLPEYNVWENIALPLYIIGKSQSEIESRVTDLLKLVNLVDKAFLFPSQLSGGEAQRVSIARALATGPSVIFADEPTGNLDPETSAAIAKLLHKINELGTTVLLATHDLGVLQSLPQVRRIHLEKGQVVTDTSQPNLVTVSVTTVPSPSNQESQNTKTSNPPPQSAHQTEAKTDMSKVTMSEETAPSTETPTVSETEPISETSQPSDMTTDAPVIKKTRFQLKLPRFSWPFGKRGQTDTEAAQDTAKVAPETSPQDQGQPTATSDTSPTSADHSGDDQEALATTITTTIVNVEVEDLDETPPSHTKKHKPK